LITGLGLTDYLVERFAIAGTAKDFANQVLRAASWGADQLWLTMPLPDKYGFLNAIRNEVQPALAAANITKSTSRVT
jgi:hypothetical protein